MKENTLIQRTKDFAVRIVRLAAALPSGRVGDVLGRQVLKSGTSIGSNYQESQQASSRRHFITTLEISLREANETLYWLDLLALSETFPASRLMDITAECRELVAILTTSVINAKKNRDDDNA